MDKHKNYARFRRELMETCPDLGEKEMYRRWKAEIDPEGVWQIKQSPIRGYDGQYHYIYITKLPGIDTYSGRHSSNSLEDCYHGSGVLLKEYEAKGVELVTEPLEFFRSYEMSLAAEAELITDEFLTEPGILNRVTGGDDSRHAPPTQPKESQTAIDKEIDAALAESKDGQTPAKPWFYKKDSWWSWARLGIDIGKEIEYAQDPSIKVTVKGRTNGAIYNGEFKKLNELTAKLAVGCHVGNCLKFWKCDGEYLSARSKRLEALGW